MIKLKNETTPKSSDPLWLLAQNKFQEWLNGQKLLFFAIDQYPESFPSRFRNYAKRPDFLIMIPCIGRILVDVKHRNINSSYESFILDDKNEIQKYLTYSGFAPENIWFAFTFQESAFSTFYWINLPQIVKDTKKHTSSKSGDYFWSIPIKMCKVIGWNDSIGRILV